MLWHTSSLGLVEIRIPEDCISDIHCPGDSLHACNDWIDHVQWFNTTDQDIVKELKEFGIWSDEDLADPEFNRIRWLWLAACDLGDMGPSGWDDSEPTT